MLSNSPAADKEYLINIGHFTLQCVTEILTLLLNYICQYVPRPCS